MRGLNGGEAKCFFDQRCQIDLLAVDPHMAGFDLRHIEDVVDDVKQMLAAVMNIAGIFRIFRRSDRAEHFIEKNFRKTENGV